MNEMSKDERVVALEYSCGLEGYAVYLKLLEIIAHQMDSTSGKCWTEYPLKYWAERLRCHHNKVIKIFTEINKVGLAEITCCDEFRNNTPPSRGVGIGVSIGVGNTPSRGWGNVRVEIRNLLKYRDNHQKNLQAKNKDKRDKNKKEKEKEKSSFDLQVRGEPPEQKPKVWKTRDNITGEIREMTPEEIADWKAIEKFRQDPLNRTISAAGG